MKLFIIAALLTFLAYGHGIKQKTHRQKNETLTSHFRKTAVQKQRSGARQERIGDEDDFIGDVEKKDQTAGETPKSMEQAVEECGQIAEDMNSGGKLSGTAKTKAQIQTKIRQAKTKAREMGPGKITKKVSRKTLAVADGAGDGLVSLVKGIQSGAWADCVGGALAIMASVAAFFGPVGMLVSIGLSVMSMLFGLFGSATGGEESTEDMIKRVLEKALREAKEDELKSEGAGLKKLYGSVSKSISNFRRLGAIEPEEAMNLYNFAFEGVRFFGILEHYISRDCKIGDATTYKEKQDELKEKSNSCLELLNLYCDLSILRQMMMTDLASFLAEKGLDATYENILELITKEQRADMKFLAFIYNPVNFPDSRYVSAKLFAAPEKYSTLSKYLNKLDDIYRLETDLDEVEAPELITPQKLNPKAEPRLLKHMVMLCTDVAAMGACCEELSTGFTKYSDMKGWSGGSIKSVYLTANRMFTGYLGHNQEGTRIGPFYGPGIFSIPDTKYRINSMLIDSTEEDATKMMRVCEKDDMDMTGACFNYQVGQYTDLDPRVGPVSTVDYDDDTKKYKHCHFPYKYKSVSYNKCEGTKEDDPWCAITVESDGSYDDWDECLLTNEWDKKIRSFSLPNAMKAIAFTEKDLLPELKGTDQEKFFYWHIGPTVKTLATPATWRSLVVSTTLYINSRMVQVCNAPNLGGYCAHLQLSRRLDTTDNFDKVLTFLVGENWTEDSKKIKSMKVPGGFRAYVYTEISKDNYRGFGPYTGPITMNTIDGSDDIIKKISVTRLY